MKRLSWILAGAAVVGASCTQPSPKDERVVLATVADAPIYLDELETQVQRMSLEGPDELAPAAGAQVLRKAVLDDLIDRRLLLREAERHNVVVGMDEVDAVYQRTRHGWGNASAGTDCSECVFEGALQEKDITLAELKRELRERLMIQKYLRDHVFARVAVTDAEIERYLEAHPERRVRPERVRALQIVVKSREQAVAVLDELRRGMTFEDAAMKFSMSPEGRNGGDLGWFSAGEMPAVFDEACFNLRPGQVSKIVTSDYGYHLFKVLDREPQAEYPLALLRDQIETELRREKEAAAQRAKLEELRRAVIIHVEEKALARVP